jgi:hypothetical protein
MHEFFRAANCCPVPWCHFPAMSGRSSHVFSKNAQQDNLLVSQPVSICPLDLLMHRLGEGRSEVNHMHRLKPFSAAVLGWKEKQTGVFHVEPLESYIFLLSSSSTDTNHLFLVQEK